MACFVFFGKTYIKVNPNELSLRITKQGNNTLTWSIAAVNSGWEIVDPDGVISDLELAMET